MTEGHKTLCTTKEWIARRTAKELKDGAFFDSSVSFGMIRGGHIDITILGAYEVDEEGNLANWCIPGKAVSGMGGAMDCVTGSKKVIVAMQHTKNGMPKIRRKCTLPLTACRKVSRIITEMAVIDVTKHGLMVVELNPQYTFQEVQAATEAELHPLNYGFGEENNE